MAKRGPAPTPSAILKNRGSWREKARSDEPKPELGRPLCPAWMPKAAKAVWRKIVPKLEEMGVLAKIDRIVLSRYCCIWVRWREANEFIQEHGEVYTLKDDHGNAKCIQQVPHVAIVSKLGAEMLRIEQQFGMTPSSRTSIQVNVPKNENQPSKARFFGAG